jgi:hypothetical protein
LRSPLNQERLVAKAIHYKLALKTKKLIYKEVIKGYIVIKGLLVLVRIATK